MMKDVPQRKMIAAARWGLVLMGIVWLILGALTIYRLSAGETYGDLMTGVVVGVLVFGNALAFLVSGWGLGRYPRFFVVLALVLLVGNIILSFTDQLGLFDILTAGMDVFILVLLLWLGRALFFSKG